MAGLVLRDGKLLRVGGRLAASLDCCCGGTPCGCISGSECVPAGQTNHTSPVLTISNVPDEVVRIQTNYYYPCTVRVCSPTDTLVQVDTHKITGLSQLNGSYPILYLRYDPVNGWVDAEYGSGCNWWAWPVIEFEFAWETTTVTDNDPFVEDFLPCNPKSTSIGGTFTSVFSARTATLDSPAAMMNYPPGATGPGGFPGITRTTETLFFPCASEPDRPLSSVVSRYTNSPFSTGNPFNSGSYGSGIATQLPPGGGGFWGPLGRPLGPPEPLSGYQLRFEDWCMLAQRKHDDYTDAATIVSGIGGTGNCARRTEIYFSPFRMTRELSIN